MSSAFDLSAAQGSAHTLHVVFGDQLDPAPLSALDRADDVVMLAEVVDESTHGPSHGLRTAMFLSAMRHFALEIAERGFRVHYVRLNGRGNTQSFDGEIARAIERYRPARLTCVRPGEWRVLEIFEQAAADAGIDHEVREDPHFYCTPDEFAAWAEGRKRLTMEYFYREQRKRLGILVDDSGKPEGGAWNYDAENRETFKSPPSTPTPYRPTVDDITAEVIELIQARLPDLPGKLDSREMIWPVTRDQAKRALRGFIRDRLESFGKYEDAMWTDEPFLYHSLLSTSLNLKLLDPRDCVEAALDAYRHGRAPLNSVEGFVRQLIGWREFIRGVYWLEGPDYRDRNALGHEGALPSFYWTGETDMRCIAECTAPVIDHGYAHHIPRLMVLGNFGLLAGIDPRAVGDWYYGMFVDSVDWVTTPNTIGMALHADGGVVGTKPYAASGKYISRMSNYCKDCGYDVKRRSGAGACPFNVFYWDFLLRHRDRFASNQRMSMIIRNVDRMADAQEVRDSADALREELGIAPH